MTEVLATRRIKSRRRPASQVRRRQRPGNDVPEELSVTLSIPRHVREKLSRDWIVRVSAKALLLHTLYSRGVCPALATDTLRVYREHDGTQQRGNPTERKFIKFGSSLNHMLEEWTLLCSFVNVERVLITLGPAWSRQRERHILDVSGLCAGAEKDDTEKENVIDPGLSHEHALSRRLTRALLHAMTDGDGADKYKSLSNASPSGSSYVVHVSIWMEHSKLERLFIQSIGNEVADSARGRLLDSCILRLGYSVTASKQSQPHLVTVTVSCSDEQVDCDWKEENGIWLSLPTSLKGFRL